MWPCSRFRVWQAKKNCRTGIFFSRMNIFRACQENKWIMLRRQCSPMHGSVMISSCFQEPNKANSEEAKNNKGGVSVCFGRKWLCVMTKAKLFCQPTSTFSTRKYFCSVTALDGILLYKPKQISFQVQWKMHIITINDLSWWFLRYYLLCFDNDKDDDNHDAGGDHDPF